MRFLFIFLMVSFSTLQAQEDQSDIGFMQNRIEFKVGRTTANGDFGDSDTDSKSGFAESGIEYRIGYQYSFNQNLAITFFFGRSSYSFASATYGTLLDQIDLVDTISWKTRADDYQARFGLVGLKYSFESDGDARIYINPTLGFGSLISPELRVKATTESGLIVEQRVRESDPALSIMYGISAGLDVRLSDVINLNFDVLYLASKFDITAKADTYDETGKPIVITETYDQPFTILTISVGLGINF